MMPLSEISANIRRSSSNARDRAASGAESLSTPSLPPSAIQSMLKTTTEMGDLGQFAIRPSRLPRSGSRNLLTRPRSGSLDTSFASALRHEQSSQVRRHGNSQGPRPLASSSGIAGRKTGRSNLSSYTSANRRRRYPPGPPSYSSQGHASPGLSQRRLHHPRSLVALSSHGSLLLHSPLLRPTQMSRPGYGSSSPSYSDVRSMSHTARPGFMRAPSAGTIVSSPASMRPRHRGVPGYRPDVNTSYTSLVRLPSPAVSSNRYGPCSGPVPLRTPTPSRSMFHQQQSMPPSHSLGGLSKSPTGSTVPQYYDYSESFIEEDCFSPDAAPEAMQPPLSMDQTILEVVPTPPPRDAQTPFGTMAGSTFHPIELPTQYNRRPGREALPSSNGVVLKRVLSFDAAVLHKNSVEVVSILKDISNQADQPQCQTRRTRSQDSSLSSTGEIKIEARRTSITSRRSCTPSTSSVFFQSAARSSRDLTMMAARVHSPPVGRDKPADVTSAGLHFTGKEKSPLKPPLKGLGQHPRSTLPAFTFSPISFDWYSPCPSARPRTSEATPSRRLPQILSPMPERPMSSQSWVRFSKILEVEDTIDTSGNQPRQGSFSCSKASKLNRVDEAPEQEHSVQSGGVMTTNKIGSTKSSQAHNEPGSELRVSQVASHDESSFGSFLDRHIECLGLQAEVESRSDEATSLALRQNVQSSSKEDATRLTELLETAPSWENRRPLTSSSCRHSSLATFERHQLKPRRLFASMDAGVPETIVEHSTIALSTTLGNKIGTLRPSYGWQTLPSISHLVSESSRPLPSVTSGELADVDTPEQGMRFKVRRRSNLSASVPEPSHLSKSVSGMVTMKSENTLHRRSKSTVLASQESHRRRRMRIRLKLTRSRIIGDLALDRHIEFQPETKVEPVSSKRALTHQSSAKSAVDSCADSSGDAIMPSRIVSLLAQSPLIPIRGSSIVADVPEPIKIGAELKTTTSVRTARSQESNNSMAQLVNTSLLKALPPRLRSPPLLAAPEFGPPLTSSDLHLSLPYADMPSTIRPTLRETKSFFSDTSSAQRQRNSIRQKLHLHSLRHMIPRSAGHRPLPHSFSGTKVKLNHSCQIRGRKPEDKARLPTDTLGMSDFAYRKRKVVERLKGWWRRQCVSKLHRRKGMRLAPDGTGC